MFARKPFVEVGAQIKNVRSGPFGLGNREIDLVID
jgi:hypothetical protein